MIKRLIRRVALALAAIAAVLGITFGASGVAQAYDAYKVSSCNWPQRSSTFVDLGASTRQGTLRAYSPGGTLLGSVSFYGAKTWDTPWEDVSFRLITPYSVAPAYWSKWCR